MSGRPDLLACGAATEPRSFAPSRRWLLAGLLTCLALPGCTPDPKGADTGPAPEESASTADTARSWWYPDGDGFGDADAGGIDLVTAPEGFVASHDDCDDDDPQVNPDAAERCNGLDDDCDGRTDEEAEDASTWYRDADGYGYGVAGFIERACEQPEGYADNTIDCDDAEAAVNPAAAEVCNGIDDDCDSLVDGDDALSTFYRDADGDAYGDPTHSIEVASCDPPAGYVAADGDCDDEDPAISPAAEETCTNSIDEDCSGAPRDCSLWGEQDLGDAATIFRGDEDTNYVGHDLDAGDIDGDGLVDLLIGAPQYTMAESDGGAAFLIVAPEAGDEAVRDVADAVFVVADEEEAEVQTPAYAGDLDGDGYGDVWVRVTVGLYTDWLSLVSGPISGTVDLETDADLRWLADNLLEEHIDGFLAAGEDQDGDGTPDLAVGAPTYGAHQGSFSLVFDSSEVGDVAISEAPVFVYGPEGELLGRDIAQVGDTNGDGLSDLVTGAPGAGDDVYLAGRVYVLDELPADGTWLVTDVTTRLVGVGSVDQAGEALAGAGDQNGDGYADIAVGAGTASGDVTYSGAVYVLYGPVGDRSSLSEADVTIYGETYALSLEAVDGGEDVDADGWSDLLVGSPGGADSEGVETWPGRAFVFRGPLASGTYTVDAADSSWLGEKHEDHAATALDLAGDTDGDGYADLVVGAYDQASVADFGGAAYLIRGGSY